MVAAAVAAAVVVVAVVVAAGTMAAVAATTAVAGATMAAVVGATMAAAAARVKAVPNSLRSRRLLVVYRTLVETILTVRSKSLHYVARGSAPERGATTGSQKSDRALLGR